MAENNFVALNCLRKECESGLEIHASGEYFHKDRKVSKYRNDTYSLRIWALHCCLVVFAPPADLTPQVFT